MGGGDQRSGPSMPERSELARFAELSDDLFCIADFEGRFLWVNAAWERVLGWSTEELTSQPYAEFIHPGDLDASVEEAAEITTGRSGVLFENRYRHRDGTWRWLMWRSVPIPEEQKIYAIARDVTPRREAEEALRRSNQDLEQFAYVASHDLQEPLRGIASYLQLLEQRLGGDLDDRSQHFLQRAVEASGRMRELVQDLLAWSRVQRGRANLEPISADQPLAAAIQDVAHVLEATAAKLTHDPLPRVRGDSPQLRQVFQNLLSNALKFAGDETPRIHVGAERLDGWWRLYVRDQGIGIAPKHQDRIFLLFKRLHGRDEIPGTGIGLTLCRKIIERHGGQMGVESEPGEGTTFWFTLQAP